MSMPELPEGLYWRVHKLTGDEKITVSMESVHNHPVFPSMGGQTVNINGMHGPEAIVAAVERAAWNVFEQLRRDIYIQSIIEENWPCQPPQN